MFERNLKYFVDYRGIRATDVQSIRPLTRDDEQCQRFDLDFLTCRISVIYLVCNIEFIRAQAVDSWEHQNMTTTFAVTDRLAVSPAEAAELIGASRKYVDRCIVAGSLASVKRGGRRFVTGRALDEFLTATPATPAA